ncbi:MAG: hypothetical protein KQH63_07305 [Desulfobulbaceae bacterium]|nr:hypothetical protein [Desulfobulbaceae bacterium]
MKMLQIAAVTLFLLVSSTVQAEERFNYGESWKKATVPQKMFFLNGYQNGYIFGVMNATKFFMPTNTDQEKEKAFKKASMIYGDRLFGKDMLANIVLLMDNLYADEANRYIDKSVMLDLAIEKIRGQDISEALKLHREAAEGTRMETGKGESK